MILMVVIEVLVISTIQRLCRTVNCDSCLCYNKQSLPMEVEILISGNYYRYMGGNSHALSSIYNTNIKVEYKFCFLRLNLRHMGICTFQIQFYSLYIDLILTELYECIELLDLYQSRVTAGVILQSCIHNSAGFYWKQATSCKLPEKALWTH